MSSDPSWLRHAEWVTRADRLAPLVDGVEYFPALREAILRARRQIWILGWDIHSEIDLLRGSRADAAAERDEAPVRLADLLEHVLDEQPQLEIRLLVWEGSPLFAFERQQLPRMKRPWTGHDRMTLVWDRLTPPMGSQHQKIVVIDDRVAFVGGMDLTQSRWDTHRHEPNDERRRNPGLLASYGRPYHDIMMALEGEAARVVGDWCRERWLRATEEACDAPATRAEREADPWPPGVEPPLRDRRVALAVTQPAFGGREEKRQVEQLFVEQIAAARESIFIENQYFSSSAVCDALCERLREPGGPQIILILPYGCPGALQSMALDVARDDLIDRLREADRERRLGIYWPTLRGGDEDDVHENAVYVHAKTLVIDDALLRIGSANLANRSMGLDSELDAVVWVEEGEPDAEAVRAAIAHYRRRLLAYLLHVEVEEVARAEESEGSVLGAVEKLREGQRTLHPFEHRAAAGTGITLPVELADPDRPLTTTQVLQTRELVDAATAVSDHVVWGRNAAIGWLRRHKRAVAFGAVVAGLVFAWTATPLRDAVDAASVEAAIDAVRSTRAGVGGVIAGFWIACAVGVPVTLVIASVAAVFGGPGSVAISIAGVAGSATLGFYAGRLLPDATEEGRFGGRIQRIVDRVQGRSVLALALLRNVPIAPYAIVNLACGCTPIPWRAFLAGTLLGMGPGIVVASLFGRELGAWLADPTWLGALRIAGAVALLVGVATGLDRLLRDRVDAPAGGEDA